MTRHKSSSVKLLSERDGGRRSRSRRLWKQNNKVRARTLIHPHTGSGAGELLQSFQSTFVKPVCVCVCVCVCARLYDTLSLWLSLHIKTELQQLHSH